MVRIEGAWILHLQGGSLIMFEPPDYDAEEERLRKQNVAEVLDNLEQRDKNLLKKIETFSKNFSYAESDIENQIMESKMFACTFSIEPSRQGFHEKVAAQWLVDTLKCNINILPKKGKSALYVTNDGNITQWDRPRKPSKSLDFKWTMGDITIYAMHKYTKVSGGAQDNQFDDVRNTLDKFLKAQDPNVVFIAIVDGNYYTEQKLKILRGLTRNNPPRSYVTRIEGVPDIMKTLKS